MPAQVAGWKVVQNTQSITSGLSILFFSGNQNKFNEVMSQLWRNTGSAFEDVTGVVVPGLPGIGDASMERADYDNDGRLDF